MTIDTGVRRLTRRVAVALGLAGVVAGVLLPSTARAQADTMDGPDIAGVELMEDALDALSDGDNAAYDALVGQAFDGSVWLPSAAIIALDERDPEDIVVWLAVIDSDDDDLVSEWAYLAIESERAALAVLDDGVTLTVEQNEDIDDADFDGGVVLEIIDHRGVVISEPTRAVLTSSLDADGVFPDDVVYEQALSDIETGPTGSEDATPPALAEPSATEPQQSVTTIAGDAGSTVAESTGEAQAAQVADPVEAPETADAQVIPTIAVVAEGPTASSSSGENSSLLMVIAIALAATALLVGLVTAFRGRKTDRLADIAFTDGLTGLNNRRRLDADVAAQRERGYRATSALMVDVDHFKQFNDTHGHDMGDEVLRLVGDVLSREFRKTDVPYRYGGEEFCVLLNDVTTDEAHTAGERLRQAIEAIELPITERITASIGVSTGPAMELPSTIKRADSALYDAKDAGRNRVAEG